LLRPHPVGNEGKNLMMPMIMMMTK
jgi:hypothetical protein